MPWVVVEFLPHRGFDGLTVQTIPHSWVSNEVGCPIASYPPAELPPAVVQKMIRRQQHPAETWDKLPCSYATAPFDVLLLIPHLDDILAAIHIEVDVANCNDTDLEGYVTALNRGGKRRRKVKQPRYFNEPDSESQYSEDELSDPPSLPDTMHTSLPSLDKTRKTETTSRLPTLLRRSGQAAASSIIQKPGCSGYGSMGQSYHRRHADPPKKSSKVHATSQVASLAPSRGAMSMERSMVATTVMEVSHQPSKLPTASPVHGNFHASDESSVISELKDFIRKELDDLKKDIKNELRRELRSQMSLSSATLNEKIDSLSAQLKCLPVQSNEMELMHDLPMHSIEEIQQFEEEISSNSEYRKFMVHYLRDRSSNMLFRSLTEKLVATAINKTVNDVMSLLMDNELGNKFCMKGRNPCKVSFEKYFPRTVDTVFDVLKNKNPAGTQLEKVSVGRAIGEWFRLAKLRGGVKKTGAEVKE